MIKLIPLLEIKINNPNSPSIKFKRFVIDWKDMMDNRINPILRHAYSTRNFNDKLINFIKEEHLKVWKKHHIDPKYLLNGIFKWLVGIKNETLPMNSSGSYFTALNDDETLDFIGRDDFGFGYSDEDEEEMYNIIDSIING